MVGIENIRLKKKKEYWASIYIKSSISIELSSKSCILPSNLHKVQ